MYILDVHTHFSIETSAISEDSDRVGFVVENKSIEDHLLVMDRLGITKAVLTCPTLKYLDDPEACKAYCRQVNEAGARIIGMYPERFAFAASLPLPFVEDALAELSYAKNVLGAAAAGLCSNYNGLYLGNPELEPLFSGIEQEGLPVILHPAAPPAYPKEPITGKILPMFEFIADTTRTLLDLFSAGVLNRHPGLKIVVPHSGSCLPVALDRYYGIMRVTGKCEPVPTEQLYFDLACDAYPRGVPILLTLTDTKHILYGTDYPAIPEAVLRRHLDHTLSCEYFDGCLEDVLWNNGADLFKQQNSVSDFL